MGEMIHVKHSTMALEIMEETVALGDGYKTALCVRLPPVDELARTLCAFSNSNGGTLFIGISSSGRFVHSKATYSGLHSIENAAELLTPAASFSVEAVDFKNHELILIRVQESSEKPCFMDEGTQKIAYIRTDNGNAPATKKDMKRFRS
jgi:predicted HTH transcriptional regulator